MAKSRLKLPAAATPASCEPSYAAACSWWSDLPNIWTPVGWKDHLFRFNIFWSGMLLAQPNLNNRTEQYAGQGLQAMIVPSLTGNKIARTPAGILQDDGSVKQGWTDDAAPVLWTEWSASGLLLRQYVFAHIHGGGPVRTGDESIYAWVRLEIHELCPALPLEDRHGFIIRLNAPHITTTMSSRGNVRFDPSKSLYPRPLTAETAKYDPRTGWRILEPDGRVRMAIAAGQACDVNFQPCQGESNDNDVFISMQARRGRHVDLLIPMLPTDWATFDRELSLGYAGALKQANRFWAPQPRTAARVRTAEPQIDQVIRHSLRIAEILGEKNPATLKDCFVLGSFTYAKLWATPGAMTAVMLQDMLGHHESVGRCLEIFRTEQGTVRPPGPAYAPHEGYLSTPELYKSIDWLSDHGAILYAICMHALLSGDREFLARFEPTIVKACQWIKDARAITGHGGVEGVLPPAVATDRKTPIQAIWNDGWNYKGLTAAVTLLRQLNHPLAEEFAREAAEYRDAFLRAYRARHRRMPAWTDAAGRRRHLAPTSLAGDTPDETRHAFYLDTGPLFGVFSGLMDANEPAMRDCLAWFRDGPPRRFYRYDANHMQLPSLHREMSSCEPMYSWNVFHSHQLGDRRRFLDGMYSLLAGAISRKTFISCETRGGITGLACTAGLAIYLARLSVIDDQIAPGRLHLLRLMPPAWLGRSQQCSFQKMPTIYGPVSLTTKVFPDGRTLDITWKASFHTKPQAIILHRPEGVRTVKLNGKAVKFKGQTAVLAP